MLSAGRNTPEIADGAKYLVLPVAADTVIYEGSLIAIDASGNAAPATKAVSLAAAGRAEEFADNTDGLAGAVMVKVKRGAFVWNNSTTNAVTKAHVLQDCYIEDDSTVSSLATGSSKAGTVLGVTEDGVLVEIKAYADIKETMTLADLSNVAIANPANGQILAYNGTAWVNIAIPAQALSALTGVTITNPQNGQVLKYNGTVFINAADAVE